VNSSNIQRARLSSILLDSKMSASQLVATRPESNQGTIAEPVIDLQTSLAPMRKGKCGADAWGSIRPMVSCLQ